MNGGLHIAASEPIIDTIVTQHAEETSFLWVQRGAAVRSPHFSLRHLARQDERVAAHIDGLRVAGEAGLRACEAQSVPQEPGAVFAAMVLALEIKHLARIERIFSLAEALPPMQAGLISAFGWVSSQFLQGTVKELLAARSAFHRRVGVACCAMHGIYPGRPLDVAIDDADPELRERALRAAGELSRRDLLRFASNACATRTLPAASGPPGRQCCWETGAKQLRRSKSSACFRDFFRSKHCNSG